jgi:hypothetical protein
MSHLFRASGLLLVIVAALSAGGDDRMLPRSLSKEQQEKLLMFLKNHQTPTRYVPKGAKIVDIAPSKAEAELEATKEKPIKQYTVTITPHRPVPGEETVTKADVVYYRPNPEKGKQGLTVKYTVDLTTGKPIGDTEVMTKAHTALSRDELALAVAAAKENADVKKLYEGREARDVRYEFLQMKINRKSEQYEPGDRVVRFVFTANPAPGETPPAPVAVVVNLTKEQVYLDKR